MTFFGGSEIRLDDSLLGSSGWTSTFLTGEVVATFLPDGLAAGFLTSSSTSTLRGWMVSSLTGLVVLMGEGFCSGDCFFETDFLTLEALGVWEGFTISGYSILNSSIFLGDSIFSLTLSLLTEALGVLTGETDFFYAETFPFSLFLAVDGFFTGSVTSSLISTATPSSSDTLWNPRPLPTFTTGEALSLDSSYLIVSLLRADFVALFLPVAGFLATLAGLLGALEGALEASLLSLGDYSSISTEELLCKGATTASSADSSSITGWEDSLLIGEMIGVCFGVLTSAF